jgi:Sec-independent protein translocase protein TatA
MGMTIFGIGGFEVLLIGAIALFVLGPKRLLGGIREGRRVYTDLKRQRDALQSLITEAIDLEDIKKQVNVDEVKDSVASLKNELAIDQLDEDGLISGSSSVPRKRQLNRANTAGLDEIRHEVLDPSPLVDEDMTMDSDESKSTS